MHDPLTTTGPRNYSEASAACAALEGLEPHAHERRQELAESLLLFARALHRTAPAGSIDAAYSWYYRALALSHRADGAEEAEHAFRKALALRPEAAAWWLAKAIHHKRHAEWRSCEAGAQKAIELGLSERSAAWNLAIAATALGKGDVAQRVWQRLGVDAELVAGSALPVVRHMPPARVRVFREGRYHDLSVSPMTPCHGVVAIPAASPDAGVDFGDVVLWDGAPMRGLQDGDGRRRAGHGFGDVPVFPYLATLRRGQKAVYHWLLLGGKEEVATLVSSPLPDGLELFAWEQPSKRGCLMRGALVADPEVFGEPSAIERWLQQSLSETPGLYMAVPALYEALGQAKKAGEHHRLWFACERGGGR